MMRELLSLNALLSFPFPLALQTIDLFFRRSFRHSCDTPDDPSCQIINEDSSVDLGLKKERNYCSVYSHKTDTVRKTCLRILCQNLNETH